MHYPRPFFLTALCLAILLTIANARDQLKINNNYDDVNDMTSILKTLEAVPKRYRRVTKECQVDCSITKRKPVCGTDREIYRHKCELKRIRRCEGRRVRAIPMGFCTGQYSFVPLSFYLHFLLVLFISCRIRLTL